MKRVRGAAYQPGAPGEWPEPPQDVEFDINLPGSWPGELWELKTAAAHGLNDGDLMPLHRLLVSGYPTPPAILDRLARMIEGHKDERYRLTTKGKKPGQKTQTDINAEQRLRSKIGLTAEKRLRAAAKGESDSVISEIMAEFGVGRTMVIEARNEMRRAISENEKGWPGAFEYMCRVWSVS